MKYYPFKIKKDIEHALRIEWKKDGAGFFVDGKQVVRVDRAPSVACPVSIYNDRAKDYYVDWVRVRK